MAVITNHHYTGFGEILPFLRLESLARQGLRIMKFIRLYKLIKKRTRCN